jgi:hypothetical protein
MFHISENARFSPGIIKINCTEIIELLTYYVGEQGYLSHYSWTAGVRFPAGSIAFYLLHSVQTGSGAHPASYPMGTGDSFPEDKSAGA